jgi:hypothetical protein
MLRSGVKVWNGWREENPEVIHPDLSRADLSGADLTYANLRGANLRGADLTRANLTYANLRGANLLRAELAIAKLMGAKLIGGNFSGADLTSAKFTDADLTRADLTGANFSNADLTRADLTGANFTEADLYLANLMSTKLHDTNLAKSYFGETSCMDISLNGLNGLSLITHVSASYISIDTLERTAADLGTDASKQHEIELFLEAAGVPQEYIEFFRSRIGQAIQFYSCFISYSKVDQALADRLYADLRQKGIRCWLATKDLKIGDRFHTRINEAIRTHDKLLVILSRDSIDSKWVEVEVAEAFDKETKDRTVLFPIRLDDAVLDCDEAWAKSIRQTRHIGNFSNWKDHDEYTKSLERLVHDLRSETGSSRKTAGGKYD